MKPIYATAASLLLLSCNSEDRTITDKAPFAEILVQTPIDGREAIINRAERFAAENEMTSSHSVGHFSDDEYFVTVKSIDLNISSENVLRGKDTIVRAYSGGRPTDSQMVLVKEYLCEVLKYGCKV